jgi:hypothetical protein
MSEAAMWEAIRPVLKQLDPERIESHMTSGIPDVNYTQGWIELKFAPRWPPRGGPLRVDHFTTAQRAWLKKRRAAGGLAFLLLKVGRNEWLLFEGLAAATHLGYATQHELYNVVQARWTRLPQTREICRWLTR